MKTAARRLRIPAVQEPLGDQLAPVVLAHLRGRGLDVVRGAPKLDLAVIPPNCPGGPGVAVERHADAAGIDEVGVVRTGPAELDVAVTEHDLSFFDASEHPNIVLARLGRRAVDVRERRDVASAG